MVNYLLECSNRLSAHLAVCNIWMLHCHVCCQSIKTFQKLTLPFDAKSWNHSLYIQISKTCNCGIKFFNDLTSFMFSYFLKQILSAVFIMFFSNCLSLHGNNTSNKSTTFERSIYRIFINGTCTWLLQKTSSFVLLVEVQGYLTKH